MNKIKYFYYSYCDILFQNDYKKLVKHLHEKQPSLSGLKQHKSVTKPKSITDPYSFQNDNSSFLSSVIFSCFTITNIRNFMMIKLLLRMFPQLDQGTV